MASYLLSVGACCAFGLLAAAGVAHVRDPGSLRVALRAHALWPRRFEGILAAAVGAAELGLGAAGLALLGLGAARPLALAAAGAALLYGAYCGYSAFLLRRRPAAPCGCAGEDVAVNVWVPARAALLTVAGAGVAIRSEAVLAPSAAPSSLLLVLLAGVALGAALWSLPAAMAVPPEARLREEAT